MPCLRCLGDLAPALPTDLLLGDVGRNSLVQSRPVDLFFFCILFSQCSERLAFVSDPFGPSEKQHRTGVQTVDIYVRQNADASELPTGPSCFALPEAFRGRVEHCQLAHNSFPSFSLETRPDDSGICLCFVHVPWALPHSLCWISRGASAAKGHVINFLLVSLGTDAKKAFHPETTPKKRSPKGVPRVQRCGRSTS